MSNLNTESVAARWTRLGAMFSVEPAERSPDIERLLLDTARNAGSNFRLLVMAGTWLTPHHDYVARHRLSKLIRDELEDEHRPTMGLLLDWVRPRLRPEHRRRFDQAIKACGRGATATARPLLDVDRSDPRAARLAEAEASALSKKWGRWVANFEPKPDAIRPGDWIARQNPEAHTRALLGGDLPASLLAEAEAGRREFKSEAQIAARLGVSRPAARNAVERLERLGYVTLRKNGKAYAVSVTLSAA